MNTGKSSLLHCSAFEIFPDHTHLSMFPVNCSTKHWSRILCEKQQSNVTANRMYRREGYGEYWIHNNTLLQRKYMCPTGFQYRISEFCMALQLMPKPDDKNSFISFLALNNHCTTNVTLSHILKRSDYNIEILYKFTDILEEFFAEGSELFILEGYFRLHNIFTYSYYVMFSHFCYLWLPPPYYPTYYPCFTSREQTIARKAGDSSFYRCDDNSVIPHVLMCNGKSDCKNSEDEKHCSTCMPTIGNSFSPSCSCSIYHYQCKSGGCVHYDHLCDSTMDCPNGDDEAFCHGVTNYPYFNQKMIKHFYITDLCDPPSGDMLMCRSKLQCYSSSRICHYEHSNGVMAYCEDGSHIGRGSLCRYIECRKHYKCPHSYCIPTRKVCDGVIDCALGDDEVECEEYKCPGHMTCHGVAYCVPPHEICDGISHCPQQEDEKYCQTCPKDCQCKGTAIFCKNVTSLLLNDQLYSPSALILYNSYNIFAELYNDYIHKLNYVWLLDLRHGLFYSRLEQRLSTSNRFLSLKFLYLNHQGLQALPPSFIEGPNILYLNLSHNIIQSVQENAFSLMQNIKSLSFVSNELTSLESHFCHDLTLLSHLYLSENPLIHITTDVFLNNGYLIMIRSEWYMVCCVAFATKDCQPQNDFVSSCSDLISSDLQITAIITQGIIVFIGNIGALALQCVLYKIEKSDQFLIISLIFADLLMGFYLLAIATVDLMYNKVFYQIVSEWTNSITCIAVGLVNFVSSEMLLLMVSILSFFRVISINKVGGMASMKPRIRITCACSWFAIVIAGILYTAYLFNRNIGIGNNMCILIGISHQRYITSLEYIIQPVFISVNLIFLLMIIICMTCIFHKVIKSNKLVAQTSGQHAKSQNVRLIRIGVKLMVLLVCNVLTWVPLLTVSVMLLYGLNVHENALQWVAVLGVPICACTDPVLYTLASVKAHLK